MRHPSPDLTLSSAAFPAQGVCMCVNWIRYRNPLYVLRYTLREHRYQTAICLSLAYSMVV